MIRPCRLQNGKCRENDHYRVNDDYHAHDPVEEADERSRLHHENDSEYHDRRSEDHDDPVKQSFLLLGKETDNGKNACRDKNACNDADEDLSYRVALACDRIDQKNQSEDQHYDINYHCPCTVRFNALFVLLVLCHGDPSCLYERLQLFRF